MSASIIAAGLLAAAAATPVPAIPTHPVTVQHRGAPVTVSYAGAIAVNTRQIGNMTPNRPSTARCLWQAELTVERALGSGGTAQPVGTAPLADGSVPGGCMEARRSIARAVADQAEPARTLLAETAARDRSALLASLEDHATVIATR